MKRTMRALALFSAAAAAAVLLAGCSDPVDTVKSGTMDAFSKTVKVGDALDRYSGCAPKTQKWTALEDDSKNQFVRFTCTLQGTDAYYKTYRGEIEQARAGVAFLQSMAEAFSSMLGQPAGPDLNRELETALAAVSVTRNDIAVDFEIDPDDKKKFSLAAVTTDFYWGGDKAQAENDPEQALSVIYEDKPFIEAQAGDRKAFMELLGKLYAVRSAEGGKASAPASASADAGSSPAASSSTAAEGASGFAKF